MGASRAKRRRTSELNANGEFERPGLPRNGSNERSSVSTEPSWNGARPAEDDRQWAPMRSSFSQSTPQVTPQTGYQVNGSHAVGSAGSNGPRSSLVTLPSKTVPAETSVVVEGGEFATAIHPSHDPISRPNSSLDDHEPSTVRADPALRNRIIFRACEVFEISIETYQHLYVAAPGS